jgi:hypothetical protein
MKIAGAIFGFLILAVVFVVWFRAYRAVKSEGEPLFSLSDSKPGKENNSIEEFIAAYKRGEIAVEKGAPVAAKPSPPLVAVAGAKPAGAAPSQTVPVKRIAFISGSTKLVYLVCKAGLRDHHIFVQVPLWTLSTGGAIDPALAVDVLVCNAAMSPVAAIDSIDAKSSTVNAAKSEYLKALGIRYLRLSAKSLPRPDELHAMLYKM